jgi:hypothetical protein
MAQTKGLYRFCFTNKSPYQETVDFDVHVNHFAYFDQHAKDGERLHFFLLLNPSSFIFFFYQPLLKNDL